MPKLSITCADTVHHRLRCTDRRQSVCYA